MQVPGSPHNIRGFKSGRSPRNPGAIRATNWDIRGIKSAGKQPTLDGA